MSPSLEHSRFSCVPVSGDDVISLSPQSLLKKLQAGQLAEAGDRMGRRLSQSLNGVDPENMMGMLGDLDQNDLVDFISEQRSGIVETMMSKKITEDLAGGRTVSPTVSPSLSRRAQLSSPRPQK